MNPWRRRLRLTRRALVYGAAVLLILLAVVVGVAGRLLPLVERHPDRVAAWLSERVGQPVQFDRARAEWTRRGPLFTLERLRVGAGERSLDIGSAELLVAMYSGLIPGRPLTELRLRGLSLVLQREDDGRWRLLNLDRPSDPDKDPLDTLAGFGELQVLDAALTVRAPQAGIEHRVPRIDLRVRVDGRRLRAGVQTWGAPEAAPLTAVAELDRRDGDGRLWVGSEEIELAPWAPLLSVAGIELRQGHGRIGLWGRVEAQRVTEVRLEADLTEVGFRGRRLLALADERILEPRLGFQRLQIGARWRTQGDSWRLDAPLLRLDDAGTPAVLDGLVLVGGAEYGVLAERVEAHPLLALAALSDRVPEGLRRWLYQAAPRGELRQLSLAGRRAGGLVGRAELAGLSWLPVETRPALEGLGGQLLFDQRGATLALSKAPVRFLWPVGFRAPLQLRLEGALTGWREGAGWRVATDRLRVRGEDGLDALARGGVTFQGDGSRPWLDLSASIGSAELPAAKRFWIMHKMPPKVIAWLDAALVSGRLQEARAVIAGDLDDWPFREHQGVFEASARIEQAQLHSHDDWPDITGLSGQVRFSGFGFELDNASGDILGNRIEAGEAGIADFAAPWLAVDLLGEGPGRSLLQVLRESPLHERFREDLDNINLGGSAEVALQLALPLKEGLGERRVSGTADLKDALLSDARWNLAFTGATGRVEFGDDGFIAPELALKLDGDPGVLRVAVGAPTGDADLAADVRLTGRFPAAQLIHRVAALTWLEPWMEGSAAWTVEVRVPRSETEGDKAPAALTVRSDLTGIALELPAPLRKDAEVALPLSVRASLPASAGDVRIRLGELMRVRGRIGADERFGGVVEFGDAPDVELPAAGVRVVGQVPVLDVAGWIGFAAGGDEDEGGTGLLGVDLYAGQLDVLDRAFAETAVKLERESERILVTVKGPEVDGSVDIPVKLERGIHGKFARLYWPSARPASAASADADSDDPTKVPPLRLEIADLRYGEARLGTGRLETYPTPEGMHIDRFKTEAESLSIDASGDWTRLDGASRSRFVIDFRAQSLGQMLDALGFVGMVEEGPTQAHLAAGWPGSPGAFRLDALQGTLIADVGEGRLLEVEPGGTGRILGLLSVAELPRRLTLDFSDFFRKGFSFNTIKGSFDFADGAAVTENLVINGPAAEIRVKGRAGLRAQDYDQTIEVLPKASSVLTAVGAIAGGPVGAAIGAVAQAVLQQPVKQMARTVYHVTGPWKDPRVTVVERGPTRGGGSSRPSDGEPSPDSKPLAQERRRPDTVR